MKMSATTGEGTSNMASCELSSENKCNTTFTCRLDWYQTESHIVLAFLAKNIQSEGVNVTFINSEVFVKIVFKDGSEYKKTVDLVYEIEPKMCTFKVLPSKIEMKLVKKIKMIWPTLEKEGNKEISKTGRNWDTILSEIDDNQLEGEASFLELAQKIYSEGSEEVQKAMNKSFIESGGTKLSTNWDEVSGNGIDGSG